MEREGLYKASLIAKWFLYYNQITMDQEDADLISNLKLQKLLYYAQGCFLVFNTLPQISTIILNI